ncbi:MAG: hypothetical protein LBD48_08065 [Treponema sp.]|nr:hypothetical protein [Treponema sp.]
MKTIFFTLLSVVFIAGTVAQQLTVAVNPFDMKGGLPASDAEAVTELFIAELVKNGKVKVVDRNRFNKVITEIKFQTSDWSDSVKVAQLGRALNANSIVRGTMMSLAGQTVITANVLDINTAQILSSSMLRIAGIGEVFEALPGFVKTVVNNLPFMVKPNLFLRHLTVAVSPFDVKGGLPPNDVETLIELFTTELVKNGARVVDRNSFDKIIREMKFQSSDWSDSAKVAQLGRVLNANSILQGTVMSLAGQTLITANILDINTAQILSSSSLRMKEVGEVFDKLPGFVKPIVDNLPLPPGFNPFVGQWRATRENYNGKLLCILDIRSDGTINIKQYDTRILTRTYDLWNDYNKIIDNKLSTGTGTGRYSYETKGEEIRANITLSLTGVPVQFSSHKGTIVLKKKSPDGFSFYLNCQYEILQNAFGKTLEGNFSEQYSWFERM